ncbi:RNA-binding S4 domain-containing protein [Rhodoferax sp.]|uniref:RNA-binding S4 domain-containing protein n=1 Tax=Rhodoferax sp. TaxID=50421 RepID=UPI00275059B1|nr:RNA-binding S4 domain-containing protein [Rhodoferax sp.]
MDKLRIDKWLWAARFYKTRSLASEEVSKGRVQVNQLEVKPARELKVGDVVQLRHGAITRTVTVLALGDKRGPAPVAQTLYAETEASIAQRKEAAELRRMGTEPALTLEHGRPTKRDRRELQHQWDERWSASIK